MLATVIVVAALIIIVLSVRVSLGRGARGVRTWLAGDVLILLAQGASVVVAAAVEGAIQPMTITSGLITAGIALHVVGIHRHRHPPAARDYVWQAVGPLLGLLVCSAALVLPSLTARIVLVCLLLISMIGFNLAVNLWPERRFLGVKMMIATEMFALLANIGLIAISFGSRGKVGHETETGMILGFAMPLLGTTSLMLWLLEELRESLQFMGQTDALTGVYNRHGLVPLLQQEFLRAHRLDRPMAVAICDIDLFKAINDRLGHAGGDAVLHLFAQALKAHLRSTDLVGRWGGEEFVVMFPETDAACAAAVLERLRTRSSGNPLDQHGRVNFSAGVASTFEVDNFQSFEALIARADIRLYLAKVPRDTVVATDGPIPGAAVGAAMA